MKRFRGKPAVLVLLVILFLILAASIRLQDPSRAQDQDTNLSRQSRSFSAAPALHSSDAPAGERVSGRPGSPTETRSRRIANYDLHVRLHEKEHRLTGRGTVVWRHPEPGLCAKFIFISIQTPSNRKKPLSCGNPAAN